MKKILFFLLGLTLYASASLAQNVSVQGSTGGPVSYATLKAALAAINSGTHTGAVTVTVVGDTNEGTSTGAVLNASGSGSASYTSIMIGPSGTRTISGAISTNLIDLNGADNVTIDGLGTLTIENTSTAASATTIRLIADATNNTVKNCTINASGTARAVRTSLFSTGGTCG